MLEEEWCDVGIGIETACGAPFCFQLYCGKRDFAKCMEMHKFAKKGDTMDKKIIIAVVAVLAIFGIAIASCPDKKDHKDAIMSVVNEEITDGVDVGGIFGGFAMVGTSFTSTIAEYFVNNRLSVKNRFFYSAGYFRGTSETHLVSIGIFGHVFTFSKDDLHEYLMQSLH